MLLAFERFIWLGRSIALSGNTVRSGSLDRIWSSLDLTDMSPGIQILGCIDGHRWKDVKGRSDEKEGIID